MNTLRRCLPLALAALTVGCQYPLPPGYVKVDPPWDVDFRAVSAEGSALTVRTEENPENGDLAFWEKAVRTRLVDVRGYKLAERKDVTHKGGTSGVEMTFDYVADGTDYSYLLTMFVKGDRVHLLEAAGVKEQIEPDLAAIRKSIHDWPLF